MSAVDAVAIGSAAKAEKSERMARLADSASDMAKLAQQARSARYVNASCRLAPNCVNFAMNGAMTLQNASDMYDKYYVQKQGFSSETYGELATLGLDLLGTFASFGGRVHNINKLVHRFRNNYTISLVYFPDCAG